MAKILEMALRIALYLRVSSEDQALGFSLEAQERAGRAWAAAHGAVVVEVYTDAGYSAKTDKRPAFKRMIADAQAGCFDAVLVHKFDRFARNRVDAVGYKALLKSVGVRVLSVSEPIDPNDPAGMLTEGMSEVVAEWYSANLARETTKGKRERAQSGYQNNAAPFGYRKAKGRDAVAELDPLTLPGYQLAVRLALEGQPDLKIAWALNHANHRTTAGRLFSKDTVAAMLRSRFYLGEVSYRGEWFAGRHPAAIEPEPWQRLQAMRAARAVRPDHAKITSRPYPLTAVLYCAECGRGMRGNHTRGYRYYRDTGRDHGLSCAQKAVRAEVLEEQLGDYIAGLTLPDDWQARALKMLGEDSEAALEAEQSRRRLEGELERAKKLYIAGDLTEGEYNQEKARVRLSLANLVRPAVPDLAMAAALLADFGRLWEVATGEERKRLVGALVARAWVRGGAIVALEPKATVHYILMSEGKTTPVGSA
jgi:DNA invertase Pin-like site-specific DNA recombinase